LSTKIHTLVDALGNPLGFFLTPGQAHDLQGADALLPDMKADTLLADKAFDADQRVIEPLQKAGKTCVIPPKSNRKPPPSLRQRNLQGSPSHRKLLLQAQAIPRHRHTLRQDRQELPRRNSPRRRYRLAQLRTGPSITVAVLL
jgi:transposase